MQMFLLGLVGAAATSPALIDVARLQIALAETPQNPNLGMLALQTVVHVKPPPNTKTVVHVKEANGGYAKGSPLYRKQEGLKEEKKEQKQQKDDKAKKDSQAIMDTQNVTLDPEKAAKTLDPEKAANHVWRDRLWEYILSVSVYAIFVVAGAYAYTKRTAFKTPAAGARAGVDSSRALPAWTKCGFAHSLFDVGNMKSDWPICLIAYLCPIIQWADTASRSTKPFMSYWKAIAFLLAMVILSPFTLGLTGLVILIAMKVRRADLREGYGHTTDQKRSRVEDLCLVFCCNSFMCCQLVQEAREVEYTSPKVITV